MRDAFQSALRPKTGLMPIRQNDILSKIFVTTSCQQNDTRVLGAHFFACPVGALWTFHFASPIMSIMTFVLRASYPSLDGQVL